MLKNQHLSGRGKHSKYKLYIGWQHYTKGKYRVVTVKKCGGIRHIDYNIDEAVTVDSIMELATKLFYPDGQSWMGKLSDMSVTLANFSGHAIEDFTDLNKTKCNFQEYLKANGMYSSQCHLYFRTKPKKSSNDETNEVCSAKSITTVLIEESNIDEINTFMSPKSLIQKEEGIAEGAISTYTNKQTEFLVNNKSPGTIQIRYTKERVSSYSSNTFSITCHSSEDCFNITGQNDDLHSTYNAIDDGFLVTGMKKDDKQFISESDAGIFAFPQDIDPKPETIILHGPGEIHGLEIGEERFLVIGVVTVFHNKNYMYRWYKDSELMCEGLNVSVIRVNEAGIYTFAALQNEKMYIYDPPIEVKLVSTLQVNANVQLVQEDLPTIDIQTSYTCTDEVSLSPAPVFHEMKTEVSVQTNENWSRSGLNDTISNTLQKNNQMSNQLPVIQSTSSTSEDILSTSNVPEVKLCNVEMGQEIGRGAFGMVYKAEWIGTTVAVKKLTVQRIKMVKNNLKRELQIHSKIRHPNIVQLMGYAIETNNLYLISEFVNGTNLDEVLFGGIRDGESDLNLTTKFSIAQQITQAVAYLHNIEPIVVHRDIKPENILISTDYRVVKLCDMGLSKLKTMNTLITTMAGIQATQPGTPAYQAPEVLVEKKSATAATDVWSLACTLVELFSEETVWKLDAVWKEEEVDEDSAQLHIASCMKKKSKPDGLDVLLTRIDIPIAVVDIICKGLAYEQLIRPTAIQMLKVFRKDNISE